VDDAVIPGGERGSELLWIDSVFEWESKSWAGSRELLVGVPESFGVPDNEDVSLSAKKPRRFDDPRLSDRSGYMVDGKMLRMESWSEEIFRNRVVAGVGRGVASLDVRRLGSDPSGEDDLLAGCISCLLSS
jgi:hypothetical protein